MRNLAKGNKKAAPAKGAAFSILENDTKGA